MEATVKMYVLILLLGTLMAFSHWSAANEHRRSK
jgi:hypothetical protein